MNAYKQFLIFIERFQSIIALQLKRRRSCLFSTIFICCFFLLVIQILFPSNIGKYIVDTVEERPLFSFNLRPWKVENAIRNNKICKGGRHVALGMVFVVKSSVANVDRRNAIRYTWGNVKVYDGIRFETVFVVGESSHSKLSQHITRESKTYGDILQLDATDSAQLVPEKVLGGMQWASELPMKWFYTSTDDDIVVHTAKLAKYFKELITNSYTFPNNTINFVEVPIVCIYSYQSTDLANKNPWSKWYMPFKDYSGWFWPVYCRGGAYSTTNYMVKNLYQASRKTPRLYLDDVWVTGFMRLKLGKLSNKIAAAPGSRTHVADKTKTGWFGEAIVKHLWGNMANSNVDIARSLFENWKPVHESIKEEYVCFENNIDQLIYEDIVAMAFLS